MTIANNIADRLIVALDFPTWDEALSLAQAMPEATHYKIGLEMFVAGGARGVGVLKGMGKKVFLDLKFHDIPNTVAQACCQAALLGADMMNLHAAGGPKMMSKAAEELAAFCSRRGLKPPALVAVTLLTSMDLPEMMSVGFAGQPGDVVTNLARLAKDANLGGVVASPLEIGQIREACGQDFLIVCPGIRPPGTPRDDQMRTLTAREAIACGADHIVVGRPITKAADPRKAAQEILHEIEQGFAARQVYKQV